MGTQRADELEQSPDTAASGADCRLPVGKVEHYVTAAFGIALILVFAAVFYPWLAATSEVLDYLSSTMLVFTLAAAWLVVWLALELLWEWRSGRLTGR